VWRALTREGVFQCVVAEGIVFQRVAAEEKEQVRQRRGGAERWWKEEAYLE
jgi:hypothetical protein